MSKTRDLHNLNPTELAELKAELTELLHPKIPNGLTGIEIAIDDLDENLLRYLMDIFGNELRSYISPEEEPNTLALGARINWLMQHAAKFEDPDCVNFYLILLKDRLHEIIEKQLLQPVNKNPIALTDLIEVFGKKTSYDHIERAAIRLKYAMHNPVIFIEILRYLNGEFVRYYFEKHGEEFPTLNKNSYEFKNVSFYEFPNPKPSFKHINKRHALQEFLLHFLRKTGGWAPSNKSVQWLGFVPARLANADLKRASFIVEIGMNEGLFHGIMHMFHLSFIAVLIQNKILQNVTLKEIARYLVTKKFLDVNKEKKILLWQDILDQIDFRFKMFGDPFLLHSLIMKYGHNELKTPALADSLIDTFCKKLNILANINSPATDDPGILAFRRTMVMTDYENKNLAMIEANAKTATAYIDLNQAKGKRILSGGNNHYYARIEKEYHPNDNFILKECRLSDEALSLMKKIELNTTYKYSHSNRWHLFNAKHGNKQGDAAKAAILDEFKNELKDLTTENELEQFKRKLAFDKRFKTLQTGQGITTRFLNSFWHLKKTTSEKTLEKMMLEKRFLVL